MFAVKVGRVKMAYPAESLVSLIDGLSNGIGSRGRVLEELRRMGYGTTSVNINVSLERGRLR